MLSRSLLRTYRSSSFVRHATTSTKPTTHEAISSSSKMNLFSVNFKNFRQSVDKFMYNNRFLQKINKKSVQIFYDTHKTKVICTVSGIFLGYWFFGRDKTEKL